MLSRSAVVFSSATLLCVGSCEAGADLANGSGWRKSSCRAANTPAMITIEATAVPHCRAKCQRPGRGIRIFWPSAGCGKDKKTTSRHSLQSARCANTRPRSASGRAFSANVKSKSASGCGPAVRVSRRPETSFRTDSISGLTSPFTGLGSFLCERSSHRFLRQTGSQIQGQIANINVQRLLGLAAAHTLAGETLHNRLAQLLRQPLHFTADGGFVHGQSACDFGQRPPVQKIRRKHEALLRAECAQRLIGSALQFGRGRGIRIGQSGRELDSIFGLLVKAHQPTLPAIGIDKLLREDGTEPAFERSASAIRLEFRNAFTLASLSPE